MSILKTELLCILSILGYVSKYATALIFLTHYLDMINGSLFTMLA
jgi:hypothetical protein